MASDRGPGGNVQALRVAAVPTAPSKENRGPTSCKSITKQIRRILDPDVLVTCRFGNGHFAARGFWCSAIGSKRGLYWRIEPLSRVLTFSFSFSFSQVQADRQNPIGRSCSISVRLDLNRWTPRKPSWHCRSYKLVAPDRPASQDPASQT